MNHFFQEKAMKYRSLGLGDKELKEEDYRLLIHQEYTFLKRPVFLTEKLIFIGNAKKNHYVSERGVELAFIRCTAPKFIYYLK